jgi:arylsulfatase A-like enzyme
MMTKRFTRREFLQTASWATVGLGFSGCQNAAGLRAGKNTERKRPNVILVITDDQGYGDLGCLGNPLIQTPALDRFYEQSIRLTNFHVGPTCSPTRAALMTGRYCNRTGVWHTIMGRSLLRKDEVTMADVFSANGYRTAIFGKWHLGDNYPFRPQDRGFQEVFVHGGGGVGHTPDYWGNDYFDDTYYHNGKWVKCTGYCTDVWFDGCLKFIEENRDRPFFAYVPTNAAHGPYNVAEKYSDLYKDKNVPNANFYGMITNIDENMARLVGKLKELQLEEDTILIFLTDNGTAAGFRGGKGFNAGMRGTKGSEYDGGHRVPCFIRWPRGELQPAGTDVDRLTAHVDLLPTLIDLCDLKNSKPVEFDGASIRPLLAQAKPNWPDRVLITDSQRIEHPQKWRKSAVMTDRWRLVNGQELYDITDDTGQKNNIADQHPQVMETLRRDYDKWWQSVSERFDEYCETIIGSEFQNPVCLTSHDWHGDVPLPWNQSNIRRGLKANGFWAVQIARAGRYEFELRRWPLEVNQPINAAIDGGKAIRVNSARLKIGDVDRTVSVQAQDKFAKLTVQLPAGKTTLQTWFSDEQGNSRGAYYVYVKRLS